RLPPPLPPLFPYTTLFRSHAALTSNPQSCRFSRRVSLTESSSSMISTRMLFRMLFSVVDDLPYFPRQRLAAIGFADQLLAGDERSEEHTSELQSHLNLVCR